jgi:tetratricopeptide (TPR) repeat protein
VRIILPILALAIAAGAWFLFGRSAVELPEYVVPGMEPTVAAALTRAREGVIDRPRAAERWALLAATLDAHQMHEEAIVCYERALALDPDAPITRYNYAIVLELVGRPDEALAAFEDVVRAHPGLAAGHYRIGELHSREGRNAEACACYRKTLELDPGATVARRRLGQALLALGEVESALVELRAVAVAAPDDRSTRMALAQALTRAGLKDEAMAVNARLAAGDPKGDTLALADTERHAVVRLAVDSISCIRRAEELERRGQFLAAIAELESAAAGRPDRANIPDRIGRNYIRLERPREAIPWFDRAVAIDPMYANGYHNRAVAREKLGERAAAIADYKRALVAKPDHPEAAARLRELGER